MPIRFMDDIVIALFGVTELVLGIGENAGNVNCKRDKEQCRSSCELQRKRGQAHLPHLRGSLTRVVELD